MIADKSSLGVARKGFYDVFIEYFENNVENLLHHLLDLNGR